MQTSPLERCTEPDVETFAARYGRPGRAVVLTGAAAHWRAARTWTVDGLAATYPDVRVPLVRNDGPNGPTRSMALAGYVRYMREEAKLDETPWYLASWRFGDDCPALLEAFDVPPWARTDWLQEVDEAVRPTLTWMFIGPAGSGSWLHLDIASTSAWNVQLTGRKRWILFPPGQDACLYDGRVDAFRPDLRRFPALADAHALVADVGPGDVIYTPSGWWHQTLNLDEGIAVTANFANEWNWRHVVAWLDSHPIYLAKEGLLGLAEAFRKVVAHHEATSPPHGTRPQAV